MSDDDRKRRLTFAIFWAMWQRGYTPPRLAKEIGRSADAVRSWRDGEHAPSVFDLAPLAAALQVEVNYFTDPPPVPDYPFEEYTLAKTFEQRRARRAAAQNALPSASDAAALALEEMAPAEQAAPDAEARPAAGRRRR